MGARWGQDGKEWLQRKFVLAYMCAYVRACWVDVETTEQKEKKSRGRGCRGPGTRKLHTQKAWEAIESLQSLKKIDRSSVCRVLGRVLQNQNNPDVLLSVISALGGVYISLCCC